LAPFITETHLQVDHLWRNTGLNRRILATFNTQQRDLWSHENETVIFPVKTLYFIALTIGKRIEATIEGVMAQFLLNDGGKTAKALSEIYRIPIEENPRHLV
jgi:hypothetical protein